MFIRLLTLVLVIPLLFGPVLADEGRTDTAADFHLVGVLVSSSGRSALINGEIAREGDRIAGAEIISIREGEVRIRMGSQDLTVPVGSTTAATQTARSFRTAATDITRSYGPVMEGETLSHIAQNHRADDITINQMMLALFEANPKAFDDNINRLREGAVLRVPDTEVLQRRSAAAATTEVIRQTDVWRTGQRQPQNALKYANVVDHGAYGPVVRGETLSGIAAALPHDGATLNQKITAIFHANPQAFSGNMNVLLEGAVLRIPDTLIRQSPEMATAEVARHIYAWRHDPGPPDAGIMLSMNSTE